MALGADERMQPQSPRHHVITATRHCLIFGLPFGDGEFGMSADSAIMNPVSKIIAVRNGGKLRTFNLELQSPMKGYEINDGSTVKYWCWLTPRNCHLCSLPLAE